jgi:hypothetical protein
MTDKTDDLPALPFSYSMVGGHRMPNRAGGWYDADQMREYGRQCTIAAAKRAAQVCYREAEGVEGLMCMQAIEREFGIEKEQGNADQA